MERDNTKFQLKWYLIHVGIYYTLGWGGILLSDLGLEIPVKVPDFILSPFLLFAHVGIDATLSYYYEEKKGIRFIKLFLLGVLYVIGLYVYAALIVAEFIAVRYFSYNIESDVVFQATFNVSLAVSLIFQVAFAIYRFVKIFN